VPAGCLQTGKQFRGLLAQRRYGLFEFTLALGDILVDRIFILEIVGNRAIYLRKFQGRK
jgi:hypothetical protein